MKNVFSREYACQVSLGCIGICIEATDREAWHRKSRRQRERVCWWSEKINDEVKKGGEPDITLPDLDLIDDTQSWLTIARVHGDVLNPDWSVINSQVCVRPEWGAHAIPTPWFGSLIMAPIISIVALINNISLPNGDAGVGDRITCNRDEHKLVSIEWRGVGRFLWMNLQWHRTYFACR